MRLFTFASKEDNSTGHITAVYCFMHWGIVPPPLHKFHIIITIMKRICYITSIYSHFFFQKFTLWYKIVTMNKTLMWTLWMGTKWMTITYEPLHDKTNITSLRAAWIQTSLRIRAVWSGPMLFAISFSTWNRVGAQAGLDPCWSQTHYVGFVVTWLIYH
jgi:hypothetical protein